MTTLNEALGHVWETDWKYRRSGECLHSQALTAVNSILAFYAKGSHPQVEDITQGRIQVVTAQWYDEGLSPATITKRLNCLSKLGVNVKGCKPPKAKVLQWWLNPEARAELLEWLGPTKRYFEWRPMSPEEMRIMAAYIVWSTTTGLRVEETLGLKWGNVYKASSRWFVTVPGTKTSAAQATLPLSSEAGKVLDRQFLYWDGHNRDDGPVFAIARQDGGVLGSHAAPQHIQYDELERLWGLCRKFLHAEHIPTATLKALRRTAARHLHIDCKMPLDMVREYLRHENVETTQGYLKLVGGYSTGEMEKFL